MIAAVFGSFQGLNINPARSRVTRHALLWALFVAYQLVLLFMQPGPPVAMTAFLAKDFVAAVLGFYFFSAVVLPRFVVRRRWLLSALGLLAIYYGWALLSHAAYAALVHFNMPLADWSNYVHRTLDAGLLRGVFGWYGASQSLTEFIILPLQPILLRFLWFLLTSSNQALRLQRENLNLEVNFLKAQINPHFLFNTLNNIYTMVQKQDQRAPDMVEHLAHLMHYTVYESDAALVPLAQEVSFLEAYLELEQLRYGRKVRIGYAATGPQAAYRIAPLLFFPFVENAFKHGVDSSLDESWVDIQLAVQNSWLHFEVSNSYSPAAPRREFGGVGIANVRKRLTLHYAPTDQHLHISQDPNAHTYRVALRLQLAPATEPVAPPTPAVPAFTRI